MDDLRIGVVGMGMRGGLASHAHRPGEGARVVAVCDLDPGQLAKAAEEFPEARPTRDFADLVAGAAGSEIDAVILTTPDDTHEELACAALAAGKATFVEKPLAITIPGCDRVLRTAYEHRARLYVGHNMRHMRVIRTMRDLVRDGAIGEVTAVWCRHFVGHGGDYYYKDWHADRRRTTSLLLQKGAHDIDVIHWLAGGVTRRVTGMGELTVYGRITDRLAPGEQQGREKVDLARNWPPLSQRGLYSVVDVEDLSMMQMRLDNGVFATYQQCHYTPDYWRNYTVIGTEGRLENFGDTGAGTVVRVWNSGRREYDPEGDLVVPVPLGAGGHGGADPELMTEFLRFARDGGTTDTSPVAAREAVAAGVLAAESMRGGSVPFDVPPVAPEVADYFAAGQPGSRLGGQ